MNTYSRPIAVAAMVGGLLLTGWALYAPLVDVPGIPTVRFPEQYLGGPGLAWAILLLLGLATLCVPFRERVRGFGLLCAGAGLGVAVASLLAVYRGAMDKIQQLSDLSGQPSADVAAILSRMKPGIGLWVLGAGLLLWVGGLLPGLARRDTD